MSWSFLIKKKRKKSVFGIEVARVKKKKKKKKRENERKQGLFGSKNFFSLL